MAHQITSYFSSRGSRGSVNRSPVKPRSSSSSSGPASALKTISNNRNIPLSRDIALNSPTKRELVVFCDPSPKPRKVSDAENSDAFTSSQESTQSSGSTSGNRKIRSQKKIAHKAPVKVETRDESIQTDLPKFQMEDVEMPRDALDLLADEPSENYYKDLAEARREALAETLEENQNLHDLNDQLQGERDQLSEDFLNVSAAHDNLKVELAKYSKLNETLEEENRLLKEALGLDDDDVDEEEEAEEEG